LDGAIPILAPSTWATNEVLRFAAAVVAGLFGAVLLRDHRREAVSGDVT
jgi:hypothetical protein